MVPAGRAGRGRGADRGRPVSGALLRYELDGELGGDHVEAEIFPCRQRAVRAVAARHQVFLHRDDVTASRGRLTLTPRGPRIQAWHLADDLDAARTADFVTTTAQLVYELAAKGLVQVPADAWWRAADLMAACRAAVDARPPLRHLPAGRPGRPRHRGLFRLNVVGVTGLAVATSVCW